MSRQDSGTDAPARSGQDPLPDAPLPDARPDDPGAQAEPERSSGWWDVFSVAELFLWVLRGIWALIVLAWEAATG